MARHSERRDIGNKWPADDVTKDIADKLKHVHLKANKCRIVHSTQTLYEVSDGYNNIPVDLTKKECTCQRWQISAYPCKHAFKAIQCHGGNLLDYVSPFMTVATYKAQYEDNIHPVPDELFWAKGGYPKIEPPEIERGIGRPAKNRRREEGEPEKNKRSRALTCSKCGYLGHNRRSCQGGPTAAEKKAQSYPAAATGAKYKGKGKGASKAAADKAKGKAATGKDKGKGKMHVDDQDIPSEARRRQGSVVIRG